MGYRQVEEALARQLNNISGFSTAAGSGNVSRGDYRILGRGLGSAAVIEYAGFDQRRTAYDGEHEIDWRMVVSIYARWQNEENTVPLMGTLRQTVVDYINARPLLGTTNIFDAMFYSGDSVPEDISMGGVRYAMELLRLTATEHVPVNEVE